MSADRSAGTDSAGSFSLTLDRGLRLLDLLARPENGAGMTVTALAAALGMSRSAAYRLLGTLESHGYVARLPDGRVRLGYAVTRLAAAVAPLVRAAATPVLRRLADEVGATAHLTLVDGDAALAVVVVEPTWTDVHVAYRPGTRHVLDRGAAGRAIVRGRAGELGWVTSRSELQPGAYGVAAPLPAGEVEGSVGVVALSELDEDRVGPAVVEAAREVGNALA
ncbi:MAG TPA: helix-turn-helix domain-containing protein [Lapillicoccus sp.]